MGIINFSLVFNVFIFSFFSIKTLEGTHEDTTKELISSQTLFRKGERKWMAEKEFLMRKVQFLQTYGSVLPPSIDGGGFHTENQSNKRRGGELKGNVGFRIFNLDLPRETNRNVVLVKEK